MGGKHLQDYSEIFCERYIGNPRLRTHSTTRFPGKHLGENFPSYNIDWHIIFTEEAIKIECDVATPHVAIISIIAYSAKIIRWSECLKGLFLSLY
jgi:hypothetical protein